MFRLFYNALLFSCLIVPFSTLYSQTSSKPSKNFLTITINVSNAWKGSKQLLHKNRRGIALRAEDGEIQLGASNIKDKENSERKFDYSSPRGKSYFIGASSIPIKEGEGYYQNILLSTNIVNYGLSDNLSIGGGLELISLFFGPVYFFTPRVGFEVAKNIHVGGGITGAALVGNTITGEKVNRREDVFALGYGLVTFGSEDLNLSIGAGPFFSRFINDLRTYPVYILSGNFRVSNGIAIVAENYFVTMENALTNENVTTVKGIYGISLLSRNSSFDIGLAAFSFQSYGRSGFLPYFSYRRFF